MTGLDLIVYFGGLDALVLAILRIKPTVPTTVAVSQQTRKNSPSPNSSFAMSATTSGLR
jgi:hypothetical protein